MTQINQNNNVIKFERTEQIQDEAISLREAAKIIGMNYGAAYKKIKEEKKITYFDYGCRNIKVSKLSALAYREAHRIEGKF